MAKTRQWVFDTLMGPSNVGYFRDYLNEPQSREITNALLQLADHSSNILTFREDAADGLGDIAVKIPSDLINRAIEVLSSLAQNPEMSDEIKEQVIGATNPLERYKTQLGTIEATRRTAIIALGNLCKRLKGQQLRKILSLIITLAGDSNPEVRVGASVAIKFARPHMSGVNLRTAVMQLHSLLHDSDAEVQRSAIYALSDYAIVLTSLEVTMIFDRLIALSHSDNTDVRLNVVWMLKMLGELPTYQKRRAGIQNTIHKMSADGSFRVRKACQEATASLTCRS